MSLFLKQTQEQSQLQSKIATDMESRVKTAGSADKPPAAVGDGILEESRVATGRSLFWAGVIVMLVVALVLFVVFIFEG